MKGRQLKFRKAIWIAFLIILISSVVICTSYMRSRWAGRQIDAVVEVNGLPKSDAKVFRHNAEEHILIIGDEDYFLREKEVGLGAGPFWGEYFGSIYTKSDGIYAVFPPSVKTEPWDPKPKRIEASGGTLRAIEFVSITNKRIKVKFME